MVDHKLRETACTYDRIVASYEAEATKAAPERTAFLHRFIEQLRPTAVVVDAGCGPGHDLARFVARGLTAFGVDTSTGMARRVSERGHNVVVADIRRLPVAAGSLDALWCSASLLHVPREDVPATLTSWNRLLRPGGILGLATSLGDDEGWEAVPYASGTQHAGVPLRRWFVHHQRHALEQIIRRSGFVIEHAEVRDGNRQWLQVLGTNTL